MKRLLRQIILVSGIALFAACCGAVLLSNRSVFGWQAMTVPTGSMRPGIPPGSVVLTHKISPNTLHVGEVVTYTNPLTMRSTITHRIIKLEKLNGKVPTIITKGDANPSADPPAVAGLVKGKVVTHVPYLGSLLMWAKTWPGLVALIYLPAIIILAGETRRLAEYLRRMRPYYLWGVARIKPAPDLRPRLAAASLGLVMVASAVGWSSASAQLGGMNSNAVALTPNVLTLVPVTPPPSGSGGSTTTCTNSTSTQVQNTTTQTGSSGSAAVSGNTNGGSATSGSVTNTNSTNTTINTRNGC